MRAEAPPFLAGQPVAVQFGCRASSGLRVRLSGRCGEHKRHVVSVPRVIAEYSHCRSSVPVTSVIPVCTVPPCAECPVTAYARSQDW